MQASPVNLSPLKPPEYLNPLLLPPMVHWLDSQLGEPPRLYRPPCVSGCWSEGQIDLPATTPAPEPAQQSALPQLLDDVARYVRTHSIMKPAQQLRDDALNSSLTPFMPDVLIGIVRDYAPELALTPLRHDKIGTCFNFEENLPTLAEIEKTILSGDPDKDFFQTDIARFHGHILLDSILAKTFNRLKSKSGLQDLILNRPGALQQAQSDLRLLTSYLTLSQCETLLDQEMAWLEEQTSYGNEEEQITANTKMLMEAMQRIHPKTEQCRRHDELACKQAELMLIQARGELAEGNEKAACRFFFEALKMYCGLRAKRQIVEIGIELFRLTDKTEEDTSAAVTEFISLLQTLCRTYPTDGSSAARLTFAAAAHYRKRSELPLQMKLFEDMMTDSLTVPPGRYAAKLVYRWCVARRHSGIPDRMIVKSIFTALELLSAIYYTTQFQYIDPPMQSADLNPVEFLHYYARIFQLLATMARGAIGELDQLSEAEQMECAGLFTNSVHLLDRGILAPGLIYGSLLRSALEPQSADDWLVHVAAEYQKMALKLLIKAQSCRSHQEQSEKLFVAQFDKLADFYLKYEQIAALKRLLSAKNVVYFKDFAGMDSTLVTWRKTLRTIKKAGTQAKLTE